MHTEIAVPANEPQTLGSSICRAMHFYGIGVFLVSFLISFVAILVRDEVLAHWLLHPDDQWEKIFPFSPSRLCLDGSRGQAMSGEELCAAASLWEGVVGVRKYHVESCVVSTHPDR